MRSRASHAYSEYIRLLLVMAVSDRRNSLAENTTLFKIPKLHMTSRDQWWMSSCMKSLSNELNLSFSPPSRLRGPITFCANNCDVITRHNKMQVESRRATFSGLASVPLKIIRSKSQIDEICFRGILKKTVSITKQFCPFQDSCVAYSL